MRLPRDVSGDRLAGLLGRYGYELTRQRGSHLQLRTTDGGGEHNVTVPRRRELRVGTLNAILSEVAEHFRVSRDEIAEELFG